MRYIRSRTDPLIKKIHSLHTAKERRIHNLFIAEGLRTITTLLESSLTPLHIFCIESETGHQETLKKLCLFKKLTPETILIHVTQSVIDKISGTQSPSGIVGVFHIPSPPLLSSLTHGIVLADICSPGNMGTIIRTAAALNIPSVVVIKGVDVWSPKVIQASAGTIGMVTLYECSWQELIHYKKNLRVCALVVKEGQHPSSIDPTQTLLVVGNEARGIPDTWLNDCDTKVTLPMPGNTESLNAALAVSIVMYLNYFSHTSS